MPSMPGMGRRAPRRDDVRLAHAHVTRMLANNLLPGSLADNVVSAGKEFAAWEGVCSLRACGHWISMGLPDGLYPERCPMPGNHADGAQ